jgi:hypothetical protein
MKLIAATSLLILSVFFSNTSPQVDSFTTGNPPPNRHWGVVSNLESDSIASEAGNLKIGWIRLALFWNQIEISKGVFDWTVPDIEINRATQKRLNVYVTITGTPGWANGQKPDSAPPRYKQDWVDFVRTVVTRYRYTHGVRAYGMWNEPNLKKFWTGTRSEYVNKILIPGAHAVKTLKPSLLAGGPEMSHHWVDQNDWKLADILASGAEIDVITQHVYQDVSINPDGFARFLDTKIKPVRGNRPVWITECGLTACRPSSEVLQGLYTLYLLQAQTQRADWFTKIFPYRLWDPVNSCDSGNGYGLTFGEPIRRRQSYFAYQNYIRTNTPR